MISIIIPTYNRAETLERAILSVCNQQNPDWELVIVNDGSTDQTQEILKNHTDKRIKIIDHHANRGVTAAINTGLDNIKGEWFTLLGSDDEIVPGALEAFTIVMKLDDEINAISCNCIDTTTGKFSGKGLDHDQYLGFETLVKKCSGEFWGITRTELIGKTRFNEKIRGAENIVWYKISQNCRRYYIHKSLRIYHTEGSDRISKKTPLDLERESHFYSEIAKETEYLEILKKWDPSGYGRLVFNIAISAIRNRRTADARRYYLDLREYDRKRAIFIFWGILLGPVLTECLYQLGYQIHNRIRQ